MADAVSSRSRSVRSPTQMPEQKLTGARSRSQATPDNSADITDDYEPDYDADFIDEEHDGRR